MTSNRRYVWLWMNENVCIIHTNFCSVTETTGNNLLPISVDGYHGNIAVGILFYI